MTVVGAVLLVVHPVPVTAQWMVFMLTVVVVTKVRVVFFSNYYFT